ncbi:cytidylate kinase family protein [Candidatus Woesearchaeota archaeon]|nr:cytidylate kinase family protein [Candidatus Woesearchaeota archaeon]
MRITVGGTPGSGKSTIARKLADKLHLTRYYMGQIFRDCAKEKGMTLTEYLELGETDPHIDREVDEYQKRLSSEDNIIVEGRTSFFFIPDSIKVFVKADIEEAARRIHHDKSGTRNEGDLDSLEKTLQEVRRRIRTDTKRYQKYYGIDVYDPRHFDIIIDTTALDEKQAFEEALKKLNAEADARSSQQAV